MKLIGKMVLTVIVMFTMANTTSAQNDVGNGNPRATAAKKQTAQNKHEGGGVGGGGGKHEGGGNSSGGIVKVGTSNKANATLAKQQQVGKAQ